MNDINIYIKFPDDQDDKEIIATTVMPLIPNKGDRIFFNRMCPIIDREMLSGFTIDEAERYFVDREFIVVERCLWMSFSENDGVTCEIDLTLEIVN